MGHPCWTSDSARPALQSSGPSGRTQKAEPPGDHFPSLAGPSKPMGAGTGRPAHLVPLLCQHRKTFSLNWLLQARLLACTSQVNLEDKHRLMTPPEEG